MYRIKDRVDNKTMSQLLENISKKELVIEVYRSTLEEVDIKVGWISTERK